MSEPATPSSPPPGTPPPATPSQPLELPFEPSRAGGAGCGKPLLIGCGLLIVLLGAALVFLTVRSHQLLTGLLGAFETQVVASLPAELKAADRLRLDEAFAAARRRVESEQLDPEALTRLQRQLSEIGPRVGADEPLTVDEVRALAEQLERFAAAGPPLPGAAGEEGGMEREAPE